MCSLCMCICVLCTMLGGEEWRFGAGWVFWPGGHQLDGSHVFISQLPERSLSILYHLLHGCMLLKCFPNLSLKQGQRRKQKIKSVVGTT